MNIPRQLVRELELSVIREMPHLAPQISFFLGTSAWRYKNAVLLQLEDDLKNEIN